MAVEFLIDGAGNARQFLFAHGAGAPMDSSFMQVVARAIAEHDIEVVRFEFPYMRARRDGQRRPPDREPKLLESWHDVIAQRRDDRPLFIGGKSMGGRFATMVADEAKVNGVICFGYPFHPPGAPQKTRTAHLQTLNTPTLIIQGTRDALGNRDDVIDYDLSKAIEILWIEGGDHSLQKKKNEFTAWQSSALAAAEFMSVQAGRK